MADWEKKFLEFIHDQKQDLWQGIADSGQLDADAENSLKEALAEFAQKQAPAEAETATV